MAHLWRESDDGIWEYQPIEGASAALTHSHAASQLGERQGDGDVPTAVIRQLPNDPQMWVLIATPAIRVSVNGLSLETGFAVLADRDEIRADGHAPWFFSTERTAEVEPYPENLPRGSCPRCKQPLTVGGPSVRCPGCGTWHHSSPESLACWTYGPTCAICSQPTNLNAGFQWSPEAL